MSTPTKTDPPLYDPALFQDYLDAARATLRHAAKNVPVGYPHYVANAREGLVRTMSANARHAVSRTHTNALCDRDVAKARCADYEWAGHNVAVHKAELAAEWDRLVVASNDDVIARADALKPGLGPKVYDAAEQLVRELGRRGLDIAAADLADAIFKARTAWITDPAYLGAQETLRRCGDWLAANQGEDVQIEFDGRTQRISDLLA